MKIPQNFLLSELSSVFSNRKKCESHKTVFQNKDFCNNMFSEGTKILECNKYQKSDNRKD